MCLLNLGALDGLRGVVSWLSVASLCEDRRDAFKYNSCAKRVVSDR